VTRLEADLRWNAVAVSRSPPPAADPPPATSLEAPRDQAERRQITALACELIVPSGQTDAGNLEDLRGAVDAFRQHISESAARHDGFVFSSLGDTVLAVFGYPTAHENDAEHAVRAGLELCVSVRTLRTHADFPTRCRVGIETGMVIVGDRVGEPRDPTIVGDAPMVAVRLQALAEPDTVAIGPTTRRLIGGLFDYRDLGATEVGGLAGPVPAWQVLRTSAIESRFEALRGSALTPLVGRSEEIDQLLRRWSRAKAGDGQVVLVTGEPGIGKSRLCAELEQRLRTETHLRRRYFCSPYHRESVLFPFIDQLGRAASFARDDPPATRLGKLEALIGPVAAEEDVAFLANLLSLPSSERYPLPNLSPLRIRERTLQALIRQLEASARQQPVLMVFEDAQWIDPSSQELLDLTIEHVRRLPVLLIITFRPEFQPPWTGQPRVTILALNRLDRLDRTVLAAQLAGDKALPDEVVEHIADRTDGVPLFVEELTKSVLESGLLREEAGRYVLDRALPPLAIPTSLHDSLLERLDRLSRVRQVAQIGAVIGREFSYPLLEGVARLDGGALREALSELVRSGLVFSRGEPPQALYTFKHALVRDAAYDTLLRGPRQELHARITMVLEQRFPEDVEQQQEILAQHCTLAGLTERAIGYWSSAGRKSLTRSAMIEAAAQFQKGLELLPGLPDGPDRERRELELQSALGGALVAWKGPAAPEAGEAHVRARTLCEKLGDTGASAPVLMGQFAHDLMRGKLNSARRIAEDLLRLGQSRNDAIARLAGHQAMGSCLHETGEFTTAIGHHEWVLSLHDPEINRAIASVAAYDSQTIASSLLALDHFVIGNPGQASVRNEEAVSRSRTLNNFTSLCFALNISVRLNLLRRSEQAAFAALEELISVAAEHRFFYFQIMANILRGLLPSKTGSVVEGIAGARQSISAEAARGVKHNQAHHLGLFAQACERAGQSEEALATLARALEMADKTGERWFEPELHRLRGEWLIVHRSGEQAEAEACFERALAVARLQSAKMWELRAAVSFARLRRDQRRRAEACDLLAPVYEWFTEGFDTPDLKGAKALLDELL
jgi:predicted ATPase/class 3 adenylate cyclase